MEKLSIKTFAGLVGAELEIRPITVVIGPQASGKSVIAKLIYFFRKIPRAIMQGAEEGVSWKAFIEQQEKVFERFFPRSTWGPSDWEIRHTRGGASSTVRRRASNDEGESAHVSLDDTCREVFTHLSKHFARQSRKNVEEDTLSTSDAQKLRRAGIASIQERLGKESGYVQIFITATRAFFSQTQASVFTQLREGGALDPFMVEFGSFLEQTRKTLGWWGFWGDTSELLLPKAALPAFKKGRDKLHVALSAILRGKLVRKKGVEFIGTEDDRFIPIPMTSSGQQEVLPLLLSLARFYLVPNVWGRSVYIEEPEAHLFPSAQRALIELLIETCNRRAGEMEAIVTTHSPYVLTSLNNLLKAGQRYEEAGKSMAKELEKIVPRERAIIPGQLAAYALENGTAVPILNPETGLVDPAAIDGVSELLAEEFHRLLWEN